MSATTNFRLIGSACNEALKADPDAGRPLSIALTILAIVTVRRAVDPINALTLRSAEPTALRCMASAPIDQSALCSTRTSAFLNPASSSSNSGNSISTAYWFTNSKFSTLTAEGRVSASTMALAMRLAK